MSKDLKITGRLKKITETIEVGKNNLKKCQMVIETDDKYPQMVAFDVLGSEKIEEIKDLTMGDTFDVWFNVRGNEWKDKFYTSLSMWRFEKVSPGERVFETSDSSSNEMPPF